MIADELGRCLAARRVGRYTNFAPVRFSTKAVRT